MARRLLVLALFALPLHAEAEFSLGLKMGSAGAGIEGLYHFDEQFALRAAVNAYTFSGERTVDDIDYDYDLRMQSGALLLDVFPKGGRFYLTGGFFINGNVFEADAVFVDNITIGRTTYTAAEVGEFGGDVEFEPLAPYLGVGWRWRNNEPGMSLGIEAGLLFQGQADVTLEATGPIAAQPGFQADVRREIDELEDQAGIAKFWPVLEARFAYRF